MLNLLVRLWRGEFSLSRTYWIGSVLVGLVVSALFGALETAPLAVLAPLLVVLVAYQGVLLVGLWRASQKYSGPRIWGWLAVGGTALGFAFALVVIPLALIGAGDAQSLSWGGGIRSGVTYTGTNCLSCEQGSCKPSVDFKQLSAKFDFNANSVTLSGIRWGYDKKAWEPFEPIELDEMRCNLSSERAFCSHEQIRQPDQYTPAYWLQTLDFDGKILVKGSAFKDDRPEWNGGYETRCSVK